MSKNVAGWLPSLHDYSSRKGWEEACWRKIVKSGDFLRSLVSPYERHNLVIRSAVMDMLALGKGSKQIAEELLLSPQTVSSVKKALKESGYRSYRERSKKERKKKQYSGIPLVPPKPRRPRGKPIRTKYGTIHIPNY